ncbi:MAG: hypothetical protein G01um101431_217 [Parcubacteria group bacterium Gr01-1014_31]|nr:MAG: hypothetical protein G01um101431_217 [Parcubacteria group bacterium Gr01-1014_31]
MRKFLKLFRHALTNEQLAPADREAIRSTILRAIALHPAKNEQLFQRVRVRDAAPDLFAFLRRPSFAVISLGILLAGGGVSYAAEDALPGGFLYPIKVAVTEPLRATLTFSAEQRAVLAAKLADRRLREAERLAADGRLTAETSAQLANQLTKHAAKVQANVARLEAAGNVQAAANIGTALEANLYAHAEVMTQLERKAKELRGNDDEPDEDWETLATSTTAGVAATTTAAADQNSGDNDGRPRKESTLLETIRDRSGMARRQQENLERRVAERSKQSRKAAENKRAAAENAIEETRKFLRKASARYGTAATAAATVRLDAAMTVLSQGIERFNADEFAQAFVQFQLAHRGAQEARQLIVAVKDLEKRLPTLSTGTPSWLLAASSTPVMTIGGEDARDDDDEDAAEAPKPATTTSQSAAERRREIEREQNELRRKEERREENRRSENGAPTPTPTPSPTPKIEVEVEIDTKTELDLNF